jgi:hypothetical protein
MNASSRRILSRLLGTALVCTAAGCSGLGPTEAGDVSPAIGPPPRQWTAAIAFFLDDSTQVEFFDGVRTRVVTSREGMEAALGRTPWYRVHLGDTLATVLDVKVVFPGGAGTATAEYPLTVQRDAFYSVRINTSGFDARRIIGAQEPRSYPIPAAAQKTPSDSLWIYWAARSRDCWTCPG